MALAKVIVGVDPHKLSATIEVVDQHSKLLGSVNRLQRPLAELAPGTAKKDLTALQAKAILASVRPRDVAGKTRRRIAADVGDIARFADRNRFASWTGAAPLDASSGEQNRHRCDQPVPARHPQLLADADRASAAAPDRVGTGPGGHCGATLQSSAVDLHPHIDTSDQPLPGPANPTLQPLQPSRKTTGSGTPRPPVDNNGEPD